MLPGLLRRRHRSLHWSRKELTAEGVSRAFKQTGERILHPPLFILQMNKWQKAPCYGFSAHYSPLVVRAAARSVTKQGKGCACSKGHPFTSSVPAATLKRDKENEVLFFPANTCLSSLSCLCSELSECGGRISLALPWAVAQLNHSRRQRVLAQPPQLVCVSAGKNRIVESGSLEKTSRIITKRQGPGEEGSR